MKKTDIKAGIFLNTDKDKSRAISKKLEAMLNKYVDKIFIAENGKKHREDKTGIEKLKKNCDVVFSVGGDGTLLAAQRSLFGTDIKIIGINVGRKGFLIELDESSMQSGINKYFDGDYYIEERNALCGIIKSIRNNEEISQDIAINEFAIVRSSTTGIIEVKVYISGELTEAFLADGVLVSTPTGSTAYSLSAGGPVVMPEVRCTLITPICAHSLHTRPIITPDDLEIEVVTEYRDGDVLLIADGQKSRKIPSGCKVVVKKAKTNAKFVRIDKKNMYTAFRDKMLQHND